MTARDLLPAFASAVLTFAGAFQLEAQEPQWIWRSGEARSEEESVWLRKEFETPPYTWNARLIVSADDEAEVFLNGKPVASCRAWDQPVRAEVSMRLHQGANVLAIRARNRSGAAGVLVSLHLGGAEERDVVSDGTWRFGVAEEPNWTQPGFDASRWAPVVVLGPHGMAPWGELLDHASATPAESLTTLPGFRVELLRSATPAEGSWVNMTFDPKGRIYISPEGDSRPLLRLTLNDEGQVRQVETVPAPIRFAMGLLFVDGDLHANAKGPNGSGLYLLRDRNGNDQFDPDEVRFIKAFQGSGEHGYHALKRGPDGRIYVLNGNGTRLPEGIEAFSPYRNYAEDILSLNPDETSRAGGQLAPGCHILRYDPANGAWELFAGGMRNAYDFDFSPDGELFVYDSDNEWDWGMPWYRPTRLFHAVSGAEMGWRDGNRAWADHYPDMVEGVADIGIGSPTGVEFGTHARFPERYRRALYVQDWSYGRILAVHLKPRGATYRGEYEDFIRGQPLNLTSLAFGPDGAMYFITGGRGVQSGLYRVTYDGPEATPHEGQATTPAELEAAEARGLRRRLERFHGRPNPEALELAWPLLGSKDVALRFAARLAVEAQPVSTWKDRALAEEDPTRALTALMALARVGSREDQPALLRTLARFPFVTLDSDHRLLKLRVVQLSFIRHGKPDARMVQLAIEKLFARYPADNWAENRELSRLLIWLEAPGVVPATLALLDSAPTQEQQVHYIAQLRNLKTGWRDEDRERFFRWFLEPRDHLQKTGGLLHWFQDVNRQYVDGANVNRHLEGFRRDAIAALPEASRVALKPLLESPIAGAQLIPPQPREFVREWTMADLLPHLDAVDHDRDYASGRRAFIDAQCYACHRFGNAGGSSGPEITAASSKYGRRELLETLIEPSKVVSEQYQNFRVFLRDGDDVTGRILRDAPDEIVVETDPLLGTVQTLAREDVDEIRPSSVSPMPEGLLNGFTREEILDLLAFLESGGRADAPAFQKESIRRD